MSTCIKKNQTGSGVRPNLSDYDGAVAEFTWEAARAADLEGLPGGTGLNIGHEAVTRHARGAGAAKLALRFLDAAGVNTELTYAELDALSNRFANALSALGVVAGERVFVLAPRVPGLYVAVLGTLKHRAVFSPLFPAFGPEPIRMRMSLGEARVLVTTASLYARKACAGRQRL